MNTTVDIDILMHRILSDAKELNEITKGKSASMIIYTDEEEREEKGVVVGSVAGDARMMLPAFARLMDTKPEFKQRMMAMFGSYLSNNPQDRLYFNHCLAFMDSMNKTENNTQM